MKPGTQAIPRLAPRLFAPEPHRIPTTMAVYTEVTDEDLEAFIASYDIGELTSFKGIAEGVENTNYFVHTTAGTYILTLYEKRVSESDLPYFLGLMQHLAAAGVSCPVPVRDRAGDSLKQLSGRRAALVTFLEGFSLKKPKPEHCAAVGRALAELHAAGRTYPQVRENALGPKGWRPLYERFAPRAGEIQAELAGLWPKRLPSGVIHADLFPDNVFFFHDRLSGVIDFYFACNDAFAYDIAICLNAWCFEPDFSFNLTKGQALLRGYDEVRRLEPAERDAMPVLARGAALRFLLTRAHDWLHTSPDALVRPHDPIDYLRRLRFHRSVKSIAGYGLVS
jgi:homoserine kinase type II